MAATTKNGGASDFNYLDAALRSIRYLPPEVKRTMERVRERELKAQELHAEIQVDHERYLRRLELTAAAPRKRKRSVKDQPISSASTTANSARSRLDGTVVVPPQTGEFPGLEAAMGGVGDAATASRRPGLGRRGGYTPLKRLVAIREKQRQLLELRRQNAREADALVGLLKASVRNISLTLDAYGMDVQRAVPPVTSDPVDMQKNALVDNGHDALLRGWDERYFRRVVANPTPAQGRRRAVSSRITSRSVNTKASRPKQGSTSSRGGIATTGSSSSKASGENVGKSGGPYKCSICGRGFPTSQSLAGHTNGCKIRMRKKAGAAQAAPITNPMQSAVAPVLPPVDTTPYCFCRKPFYGEMVGCDSDECTFEWFHFGCVGINETPKGKWYCPDCRLEPTVPSKPKKRKRTKTK